MAEEVVSLVARLEDNVSNAAYRVIKALDGIGDKARSAAPKVKTLEAATDKEANAAKNAAAMNYLNAKSMGKMGKEALKAEIKMRLLQRRLKKMSRAGAGNKAAGGGRGGGGGMGMVAGVGGMPITLAFTALSAAAALLPALSAGVGAIGAAAMGAIGALAPLTGLIVAYPGYLAAFGQGLAVTKMAFSGLGEAVKVLTDPGSSIEDINTAMAKLGPSGQEMARSIVGIKNNFTSLGKEIQAILLPSFNEIVNIGQSYIPMVRKEFASTAFAIRSAADSLGLFLRESETQRQVGAILQNNTTILKEFGQAGVGGARIFVDLLEAAGPLLTRMAQDLRAFVDRLSAASGANTQGLFDFFDSTYNVLRKTIRIISDFSAALYNIASIGVPLGSAMGDSFLQMAENFRAFTESESGIGKIRDWFIEMTPVVYELGYLIRDVSRALFGIGTEGNAFIQLSQGLRKDLLPVIMEFISNVSDNLIPVLLELIVAIADFFTIINPLQFIIPILVAIGSAFKVVLTVIEALGPVAQFLVGAFVAMLFVIKATILSLTMLARAKARATMATRQLNSMLTVANTGLQKVGISARFAAVGIGGLMRAAGAIGAILTVVGFAIMAFVDSSNAAKDSADDAAKATDNWARSLFDLNGVLSDNYKQMIANKLAEEGMFDLLATTGVDGYGLMVDAITGNKDALTELLHQLKMVENAGTGYNKFGEIEMTDTALAARDLSKRVREMAGDFTVAERDAGYVGRAMSDVTDEIVKTDDAATNLQRSLGRLDRFFSERAAERAYRQDLRDLRKTFKELGDEYGVNQLKTDQMDASIEQFVGNAMARANKLAEEGKFSEAFDVIDSASADAAKVLGNNLSEEQMKTAFDPIKRMIDSVRSDLEELTREQFTIKVGYQGLQQIPSATFTPPVGPENRFAGGSIVGGRSYMVGELGPEAFVGRNGNVSMIGANGPEITRFPQGGYVVPNHVLHGKQDSSVPSNVMSALAGAVTTGGSSSSGDYQIGDRAINVHIGSIQQATEFDVAKAVKKGIIEAERNRRERS